MRQLVVLVLVFLSASEVLALTKSARMDSLFRKALAQVGQVPPKVSIGSFERVLKLNWEFAPAHHQIAKLYMEINTPLTRQSARNALNEAIRLDPANNEYQLTMGELLSSQGFTYNAERQFQELAREYTGNAEGAYWAGFFAVQEYLALIDKKEFVSFEKSSNVHVFYWNAFAEKAVERAYGYLRQSIEADPGFRGAYNMLGLLHVETGKPGALVLLFKRLLRHSPDNKDAFMFCGLGYQMLGEMEAAHDYYRRAIERMNVEERSLMESVDIIASKEDTRRMAKAVASGLNRVETWTNDSVKGFWRKQDPLFLTEFNERKMEHYGRVAYANLRFSRPFMGIMGWQTDPGKAFIKFGRYIGRDVFTNWKVWNYEKFRIWFENGDGLDAWRFARGSNTGKGARESTKDYWVCVGKSVFKITRMRDDLGDFYSGKSRRERLKGTRPHARQVFQKTPQRYVDPYRDVKYRMPRQVAAFRERDSIRVEFAYAIPKSRVQVNEPEGFLDLEDGVFLFDEQWDEVYRKKMDVTMQWPEFDTGTETKSNSLRRNHMVSYRTLRVAPRQHRLVVEVRDRGTGSIGTFRELRIFGSRDSLLAMSDLLLASRIRPKTAFPEGRDDLLVTPNPLHTFGRSEPVFIYLEIYNLKRDRFGRTKFRISYRLTRPDRGEIHPERFAATDAPGAAARVEVRRIIKEPAIDSEDDLWRDEIQESVRYRMKYILPERNKISEEIENTPRSREGTETTVTARYEGDQTDDFTFLQIESNDTPAGFHKLIVSVKDLYTGQIAERHVVFRVVE